MLASLALALLPPHAAPAADPPRFRVVCHFGSPAVAEQARAAAEATWPIVAGLLGSGRERPDEPLEVHLYRSAEDYRRADRELTGGAFERNLAFAHFDSRSAHVALQPPVSDAVLERQGLPVGTLRLVAHEAAHLVRYSVAPNHRWHPGWLVDGLATWTEQRVLEGLGRSAGLEDDPWIGRDFLRARDLLEAGRLPSAADLLADRTGSLDFYDRYAARSTFLFFLRGPAWRSRSDALLREVLRIGGGPEHAARVRDAAFEHLADATSTEPWAAVDAAWAAFLRSVEPGWDEQLRLLDTSRGPWLQAAFPDVRALAWRTRAPEGPDYAIAGALAILPGAGDQLNLHLGRSDDGYLAVTFKAGYGVNLFDYRSGRADGDDWLMLARAPTERLAETLAAGEPAPFRVTVRGGRVAVDLDGARLLEVEVDPARTAGAWGLGAQRGSVGLWERVRVEAP